MDGYFFEPTTGLGFPSPGVRLTVLAAVDLHRPLPFLIAVGGVDGGHMG